MKVCKNCEVEIGEGQRRAWWNLLGVRERKQENDKIF